MFDAGSTKQKIFEAAVELFATSGYHNTSMRGIAKAVDIKQASIYNHFGGKEDILNAIFDYYDTNQNNSIAPLNDLLAMVGSRHPHEILMATIAIYPEEARPTMARAILIANILRTTNERAELVMSDLIDRAVDYDKPLLQRMIDLGEIEPLDINFFAELHANHCFACALRSSGDRVVSDNNYLGGLEMLFNLVIPSKEKYGDHEKLG